mmetsp:Transcript_2550/g.7750  ORF Transcript_2550/g.7750 Transcript_2550/m.7750 type:complete len:236 (-) Transcript_2550:353-1060(-)
MLRGGHLLLRSGQWRCLTRASCSQAGRGATSQCNRELTQVRPLAQTRLSLSPPPLWRTLDSTRSRPQERRRLGHRPRTRYRATRTDPSQSTARPQRWPSSPLQARSRGESLGPVSSSTSSLITCIQRPSASTATRACVSALARRRPIRCSAAFRQRAATCFRCTCAISSLALSRCTRRSCRTSRSWPRRRMCFTFWEAKETGFLAIRSTHPGRWRAEVGSGPRLLGERVAPSPPA